MPICIPYSFQRVRSSNSTTIISLIDQELEQYDNYKKNLEISAVLNHIGILDVWQKVRSPITVLIKESPSNEMVWTNIRNKSFL